MGYLPRFDAPGAIHHVWASGVGPSAIYADVEDRLSFLATSASAFARLSVDCLQYCLMTTHFHFLLRTADGALSEVMQRISGNYARSFNTRHGRRGHLFGRRFGSRFVQTEADLLGVVRYIALNPLDVPGCAGPGDWPWSSYANTVAGGPDPLANVAALLELAGGPERIREVVEGPDAAEAAA